MVRRLLIFVVSASLFHAVFGCGGGVEDLVGPPPLTSTDNKLAGPWIGEKLDSSGNRVALTINPGRGERLVNVTAVRPSGSTYNVTDGTYSIDGNKLIFDFTEVEDLTTPFTVSDTQLTLGTDVYYRTLPNGSSGPSLLDGPQLGGQIHITEASADGSVSVGPGGEGAALRTSSGPAIVPGEILVKYKNGSYGRRIVRPSQDVSTLSVEGVDKTVSALGLAALERHEAFVRETRRKVEDCNRDPDVEYCAPNTILKIQSFSDPTDTLFDELWNLDLLTITEAWGAVSSGAQAVVGIIDTGIVDHPDLPADRVLFDFGYDFVHQRMDGFPDLSLDGDGPDHDPTDPGDRHNLGLPGGSSWHGTHLAGIVAAAIDNGVGVAGVGRNVRVLPIRAVGIGGNGSLGDITEAVYYLAKLPNIDECTPYTANEDGGYSYNSETWTCNIDPARPKASVINLSLGEAMPTFNARFLNDAIDAAVQAGVVVVASAGNYAKGPGWCRDENDLFYRDPSCNFYPAANPNVLSIGAVCPNLSFAATYSNYGNTQFLVAPGGCQQQGILSTVEPSVEGGYAELMGTSQAAAHVSAAAAMVVSEIVSKHPELAAAEIPARVKTALSASAIDLGNAGKDDRFGWGLLNPCGAILNAQEITPSAAGSLHLSSEAVDFGSLGTTHTVIITSGCGGAPIDGIYATKRTDDGGDWLGVTLNSGRSPAQLVFTVNRSGLAKGNYTGNVTVVTPSGNQTIQVSMRVGVVSIAGDGIDSLRQRIDDLLSAVSDTDGDGDVDEDDEGYEDDEDDDDDDEDWEDDDEDGEEDDFDNTLDIGEVQLLLIDASSDEPRARTTTDLISDYHFQFLGIAPGSYYLVWGIDENLDGTICSGEDEEPCLVYPSLANPETIEITQSTKKNDLVLSF